MPQRYCTRAAIGLVDNGCTEALELRRRALRYRIVAGISPVTDSNLGRVKLFVAQISRKGSKPLNYLV